MKTLFRKYKHLTALAAVVLFALALFAFAGAPVIVPVAIVALWQLSQLAMSQRRAAFYVTALSPEQIREFSEIMEEFKEVTADLPALRTMLKEFPDVKGALQKLRKSGLAGMGQTGVRWICGQPYVSDECALAVSSYFILECAAVPRALEGLIRDTGTRERVLGEAKAFMGVQQRTALTGTEVPLPTIYASQIVELVFAYGQARRFATVFPLGAGTVKLPRLKAGEDSFGYLGVGTAGNSQSVPEKRATAEQVTFTANKAGGLIRIPFEIESDTLVALGQFLARYIARQFAKLEDSTMFLADGTSTYANQTGVGPYCAANTNYLLQLGAGKTKPSDATMDDFRNLRTKVSGAILGNMVANGESAAAYYLHPTWEPILSSFNKYPNFVIFKNDNGKPTFDGWPIRWIGVSQSYQNSAAVSAYLAFFGDLSFWYLGERGGPRVEISKEVFFATDELAMRALERIDVECLGVDAMAALQTAAS